MKDQEIKLWENSCYPWSFSVENDNKEWISRKAQSVVHIYRVKNLINLSSLVDVRTFLFSLLYTTTFVVSLEMNFAG